MTGTTGMLAATVNGAAGVLNTVARLFPVRLSSTTYGPHERHGVDIYEPARAGRPLSNVVFFYGGGWTTGSRADYRFVGRALARAGFRAFIPDYRLYPQGSWREILDDAITATRLIHNLHPSEPLFAMGHSAGAQLALRVAADAVAQTHAVVALAAPYAGALVTSERPLPPALLIAAKNDRIVPVSNTIRLSADWSQYSTVTTRLYERGGHALLVGALSPLLSWTSPVLKDVLRFMGDRYLDEVSRERADSAL